MLLIANILPFTYREGAAQIEETEPRVTSLRMGFVNRLDDNLLFDTQDDAFAFLNAATELGRWEGPDFQWEVVGVWSVPVPPSK